MSVKFNHVTYQYNKKQSPAIFDVNVEFFHGETIFIMGHTGSGKSTLIEHINGLIYTKFGNIQIDFGEEKYRVYKRQKNIKLIRKNIGMVFQFPEKQLFESSVLKDVMFGPINFGFSEIEAEKQAINSLIVVGLKDEYHKRLPYTLSSGEKRKVAIAGVLASKPNILIFDEPTASLDKKSVREFFEIVNRLKEKGVMIIIVSHNVDLAYEYADKILLLSQGKAKYYGDYKNAFTNEEILEEAGIDKPFVCRVKERLNIQINARNIKELAPFIKGGAKDE